MATTLEHMLRASMYLENISTGHKPFGVYQALSEIENAINHYLIEHPEERRDADLSEGTDGEDGGDAS